MKAIFIAGTPAMGKTYIGDYLEKHYNYSHLNLSNFEKTIISSSEKDEFKRRFEELIQQANPIVITWGFGPLTPSHQDILQYILDKSTLVWFDGNREFARKAFSERGGIDTGEFDAQIKQLDESKIVSKLNPIVINTFREDGSYRDTEDVVREIHRLTGSNS